MPLPVELTAQQVLDAISKNLDAPRTDRDMIIQGLQAKVLEFIQTVDLEISAFYADSDETKSPLGLR